MDVFEIYVNLWKLAQSEGACVHYYTWDGFPPADLRVDSQGAMGWCFANEDVEGGQPVIQIYRLECDDDSFTASRTRGPDGADLPPPDLDEELCTLAHEYGHLTSFLNRTPREEWDRYNAAAHRRSEITNRVREEASDGLDNRALNERVWTTLRAELNDDERDRIMREESLAWDIGRHVLADLGMADFARYDRRRESGLRAHRVRLGIEQLAPDDELGPTE